MATDDLLIIVPTRSRPEAVARVVDAWVATNAFEAAELMFVYDQDDPRKLDYLAAFDAIGWSQVHRCRFRQMPRHEQLVPKLNSVALDYAREETRPNKYFALGFAGDDHLPRTRGWAQAYVKTLREMRTGVVFCDDGYQHDNIPTQWAMTADIVRALGAMVPGGVEHLYCDNIVRDLAKGAESLTYLPQHMIEHMHPVVGKAATDEQYDRVNGGVQYKRDRRAYREWRAHDLDRHVEVVRQLRGGSAS